jgi:thioesterase domain-containing protein
MEPPNISLLGEAITTALAATHPDEPRRELYHEPGVTITAGKPENTPLFCIPGAGASVTAFSAFAGFVDHNIPIIGLQPRGLAEPLIPHTSVEAAARSYIKTIEAVCSSGPIHLLGHSFGGWVAMEIARRLATTELRVASLTLIDTEPPARAEKSSLYRPVDVLNAFVATLEMKTQQSLGLTAGTLQSLDNAARIELLRERMISTGLIESRFGVADLQRVIRVFACALRANYFLDKPYCAPVHLILANASALGGDTPRIQNEDLIARWKRWAPEITSWVGPGNHMTILDPPQAQILAEHWSRIVKCIPNLGGLVVPAEVDLNVVGNSNTLGIPNTEPVHRE